ncbi:MAG: aminopeptidase P family protein [Oscillospiraceae bacterium]|nr:aminopeptidase P family protein [Oscillospiraceae bacterium]MBR7056150.1 aminopeptidase P family protein [Oscillospiraceae bacterium]
MTRIEKLQAELSKRDLDAVVLFSESNVRYAGQFAFTDGAVAVARDRALLLTDSRYIEAAQAEARDVEVRLADAKHPLTAQLRDFLSGCKRIAAEEQRLPYADWKRLEEKLETALLPGDEVLSALRAVKDPEEIAALTAAQRIAEQALEEVLPFLRPGVKERDIAAELTYRMMRLGGEGNSFDPITITGANTSKPHGVPGEAVVRPGDFVTMDFGTLVGGYHSDMTRTVAVGYATDEMRRVYDTVLRAQLAGIERMRAGTTGAEVHQAADDLITAAGYGGFFGHGFGHSVGLEIHEGPSASPRNTQPLPDGAVVTAEPGIYLPGAFGVRIEDMIHVTAAGPVNLTAAPKELMIL